MADLIGQIAQQQRELATKLAAARSQIERLRAALATKDVEIVRISLPRLIKLRSQGDAGYSDLGDIKTVQQRLTDRDIVLRELKDPMRRKPSLVVGEKLRKHEWKMTRVADLPPMPLWQEEDLAREAKYGIQHRPIEEERSPPASPGRPVMLSNHMATTIPKLAHDDPYGELQTGSTRVPQSISQDVRRQETYEDPRPAPPRQGTIMRSIEAPPLCSSQRRGSHTWVDRKPVCKHCWESRQWCDSLKICTNCKDSGDVCVYLRCRSGPACGNSRCLHIHPDQWSERDMDWNVEHASLRYKLPFDPRRRISRRAVEETLDPNGRHPSGRSAKKRPRSPPESNSLEEGFSRKSVCMNCYDTRTLCDFSGRCNLVETRTSNASGYIVSRD